jgi:hypothetical protein
VGSTDREPRVRCTSATWPNLSDGLEAGSGGAARATSPTSLAAEVNRVGVTRRETPSGASRLEAAHPAACTGGQAKRQASAPAISTAEVNSNGVHRRESLARFTSAVGATYWTGSPGRTRPHAPRPPTPQRGELERAPPAAKPRPGSPRPPPGANLPGGLDAVGPGRALPAVHQVISEVNLSRLHWRRNPRQVHLGRLGGLAGLEAVESGRTLPAVHSLNSRGDLERLHRPRTCVRFTSAAWTDLSGGPERVGLGRAAYPTSLAAEVN